MNGEDELSREVGVVGLEFAEMLRESLEFCCEDVVSVRVITLAGFVMFKLVLEAVYLRETVGGRGERELGICILEICREEQRAAISAVSLALAHRAR